jgi:predicted DNA-binding protein YlxM (UPF0122 family)
MTWLVKLQKKEDQEAREIAMRDDYMNGLSLDDICKKYEISTRAIVTRMIIRQGGVIRSRYQSDGSQFKKAKEAALSDRDQIKEIAKTLGCGYYRMECQ